MKVQTVPADHPHAQIVERLSKYNQDALLPVLHIGAPTYTVTNAVAQLKDRMLPSSSEKILQSKVLFDRYIDANMLVERLETQQVRVVLICYQSASSMLTDV